MPVLYTKFLQPENVPLFIKGLLPSSSSSYFFRTTTNFFLLCGVTITLVIAFIYFLLRPGRRWNGRPALNNIADSKNEKWKNPTAAVLQEDYEKHHRSSSLLSRPKNTVIGTNNKVNFIIEEQPTKESSGDLATLNTSTPLCPKLSNPDLQLLQRRRPSTNRGLSTTPWPTTPTITTPPTTSTSNTTNDMALDTESTSNEEIVVAEGWTRHTRVYGGGVCQACVESEERMRALGLGGGSAEETGDGGGGGGESSGSGEGGQGKGEGGS